MKASISKRMLTGFLEQMAAEAISINNDGVIITRAARLSEIVWSYALGFDDVDVKTDTTTHVKPQVWAINLIYDRLDGKSVPSSEPGKTKISASKRMSALTKTKLNRLAEESRDK